MESFVLHEIQKYLKVSQEIYYWRTREKEEVDFIIVQDRVPIAVEVKSRLEGFEVPQGIKSFFRKYPECQMGVILNDDIYKKIEHQGRIIVFAPHYYACMIPLLFG